MSLRRKKKTDRDSPWSPSNEEEKISAKGMIATVAGAALALALRRVVR